MVTGRLGREEAAFAPEFDSPAQANRIVELIFKHLNSIIHRQRDHDGEITPIFDSMKYADDPHEYTDAEMWSSGFVQGMSLDPDGWQVVQDDEQGKQWLQPILLLGKEQATQEEEA
ncbi:UPF0149 family protein [Neisseriaceae bacterium TC5R-5]|nr:UPF0149 family protein [Neisseriaceae bacterium TC5R-5]